MDERISMSISGDSPSNGTLNRGPLDLLLWRQYEFLLGINIMQFSIFQFSIMHSYPGIELAQSAYSHMFAISVLLELHNSSIYQNDQNIMYYLKIHQDNFQIICN